MAVTNWLISIILVCVFELSKIEGSCDTYFPYELGEVRTVASGTQFEQKIRQGKILDF